MSKTVEQQNPPADFTFTVNVVGGNKEVVKMFETAGYPVSNTNFDAIVFTGGPDVHPLLYGQKLNPTTVCSIQRDLEDSQAYHKLNRIDFPKIGICRGAQFLCVKNGGSLWQNVNGHNVGPHFVDVEPYSIKQRVTSTHHQMMIPRDDMWIIGYATESTWKERDTVEGRHKVDPDTEMYQDPEIVFDYDTNSLMFQPHPEFDDKTAELFFRILHDMYAKEIYNRKLRLNEIKKAAEGSSFMKPGCDV